jgi:rfaE bifunctional protein kinase chain/domain
MRIKKTIPPARAEEILGNFSKRKILVIGDVMLDRFLFGKAERISPEAPVPVVEIEREKVHLGGAGNVAANISSLGGSPFIVGVIGNDFEGKRLKELINSSKLSDEGLFIDEDRVTTAKTRIIAHNQQVVRADREKKLSISPGVELNIISFINKAIPDVEAVIVSDYAKGVITPKIMSHLLTAARKHNALVAVDPKVRNKKLYRGVDVITPNLKETAALSETEIDDEQGLLRAGRRILNRFRSRALLITRGEKGMSLFLREEKEEIYIPAEVREVYDVTGAGDTVIASFTLTKTTPSSWLEAAIIANLAAQVVVGKLGTATVTVEELRESLISLK